MTGRGLLGKLAVLAAFMCALAAASNSLAERVRVPGTGVTLEPPSGFSPAERFPGFQLAERAASIMVTELPGPVTVFRKGMTRKALATNGMTLIASRSITLRGSDALLLHVSQQAGGTGYLKWMLVAGDDQGTVMVVGTFPAAAADLSGPIKRAVLSAAWSEMEPADPFEGLHFRVNPTAKLRLAKRMGNMLVFSETGEIGSPETDQAILVVGSSLGDADIESLEKFSRERAAKSPHIHQLRNIRGRGLTIDGLPGYELIAVANDSKTKSAVRLYQLLLVDGRAYYLAQGFVRPDRVPDFLPEFRRVTSSFHLIRHP